MYNNKYYNWNFKDWCKLDADDDTPIDYQLSWIDADDVEHIEWFSSEDKVDFITFEMISNSQIESIDKVNGRWKANLYY